MSVVDEGYGLASFAAAPAEGACFQPIATAARPGDAAKACIEAGRLEQGEPDLEDDVTDQLAARNFGLRILDISIVCNLQASPPGSLSRSSRFRSAATTRPNAWDMPRGQRDPYTSHISTTVGFRHNHAVRRYCESLTCSLARLPKGSSRPGKAESAT
jgi:hypothetical protein